ncbi:bsd domain-containing protein 1 [Phtheirospermum japonicum]|uniref:Bsd domain-containing protein 1 n=1 Tax=Phtheirospermum japonicum TaxID=374723 RepID=A0A830CZV2_9LAMI|nr:bsd domain-containing protein 1 [Phtheirospermum japonicum]
MDFFKSVFSDPTPDPSPPSSPTAAPRVPETAPPSPPNSSWPFGSIIFKTLASKSESLIDNYYKDLQELGSGLKKETSVIRQAASRAVQDLPARLESGAAIAQESLEAVGQAIDNVGSTVSEIIGKDLNFASNESEDDDDNNNTNAGISNLSENSKPYSRIEAIIRSVQCDIRTYCDEIDENENGYDVWKTGFNLEEKREEIERLVDENGTIKDIYDEVVPVKVDRGTFWCRYFYRVDKAVKAEEARARIVKRAILGDEEEELSWDFDDDDDNNDNENGKKGVENRDTEGVGVSGTKIVDEEEKLVDNEKEVSSDGKLGSDISIISSQRSSHAEDDMGWDEIEDTASGDEGKESSPSASNAIGLKKGLGSADEEELTWDIEDDDDEPVKL